MKATKCPAREKKMRQEKRKKGGREKAKSKFSFLRMLELRKLILCLTPYFASGSESCEMYDL